MSPSKQMPASPGRVWNAPRLVRIGTIADVAAALSTIHVQTSSKS